ncbi:MAG: topoisomerase [Verrucomicrobiales bacterium]|nr:topoisomerase [Verrucomicrobiales bacterium]
MFALSEAAERETVSVPELIKKLKAIVEEAQAPDLRMQDELAGREYDPAKPPPEQRVVYKMAFVPIATAGNIDCITAQAKYGKTAVINSIIASVLTSLESEADTFTIQSHNPDSKALVHFDTEQCPADHWKQIDRAVARAKAKAKPNWLLSYCLTGMAAHEAWKTVKFGIEQAAKKFGGVHSVLIDGVADLVVDVNDPAECNAFVAELHSIAIRHDCPIICVIHFNPGSEKARGHLGSQLERKAETNLKLEKENETTVVYSAKQRNAPISKETGPRFKWCNEQMMHVSCESAGVQKEDLKRQSAMSEIEDVFNGHPSMRYSDLKSTVKTVLTVTDRTAERRIQQWEHLKLIKKPFGSLYAKAF